MEIARKPYPSDVSDEEWALVSPYLTLLTEEAGQRGHPLREVFNGLRYILKTGAPWRYMPHDLPPWATGHAREGAVYRQTQRWLAAGCFEALADGLRAVLRLAEAARRNRLPPSSTAAPCVHPRKAGRARPMTGPSARRDRSCIWRSIPLDIRWPCTSHRPMPTIATKSAV